jgi:hypothetical protein
MNQPDFLNCDVGDTILVSNAPVAFGDYFKVKVSRGPNSLDELTFRRIRECEQATDRIQFWMRID